MSLVADALAIGHATSTIGRGISLAVVPGEVLCLLGPNGSGKTTLFRTLLGLLPPRGGRVLLDGSDLSRLSRRAVAQAVAYVPQASAPPFPFSVRESVRMGRASRVSSFAQPSRRDDAAVEAALDRLALHHLAERPVTEISGGERQLALVARALAQEPRFLVLDEPTASLDFGNQGRVLGHVRELADAGLGVLLSTHDPDHALAYSDRVALLSGGALTALAPPEEAITPAAMRRLYGIDVVVTFLPALGRSVCTPALRAGAKGERP